MQESFPGQPDPHPTYVNSFLQEEVEKKGLSPRMAFPVKATHIAKVSQSYSIPPNTCYQHMASSPSKALTLYADGKTVSSTWFNEEENSLLRQALAKENKPSEDNAKASKCEWDAQQLMNEVKNIDQVLQTLASSTSNPALNQAYIFLADLASTKTQNAKQLLQEASDVRRTAAFASGQAEALRTEAERVKTQAKQTQGQANNKPVPPRSSRAQLWRGVYWTCS